MALELRQRRVSSLRDISNRGEPVVHEATVHEATVRARFVVQSKVKELEALDKLITEIYESDMDEKTKDITAKAHKERVFEIAEEFIDVYQAAQDEIVSRRSVPLVEAADPSTFRKILDMMERGWDNIITLFDYIIYGLLGLGAGLSLYIAKLLSLENPNVASVRISQIKFLIDYIGLGRILEDASEIDLVCLSLSLATILISKPIYAKLMNILSRLSPQPNSEAAQIRQTLKAEFDNLLTIISDIAGSRTCPICYVDYDETHRKSFLNCGHSACEQTLLQNRESRLQMNQQPKCVICNAPYDRILSAPPPGKLKYSGRRY